MCTLSVVGVVWVGGVVVVVVIWSTTLVSGVCLSVWLMLLRCCAGSTPTWTRGGGTAGGWIGDLLVDPSVEQG